MLKEYLLSQGSGTGRWSHGMPGVQICRFSLPEPEQEPLRSVPVCGAPLQFEVLFCLTGRLTVRALQGASCMVEAPGSSSSPTAPLSARVSIAEIWAAF